LPARQKTKKISQATPLFWPVSNPNVNGRQIILRALLAFMLAIFGFVLMAASAAEATPMKLNLEKLLDEAQQPVQPFAPARAGWDVATTQRANSADNIADFNQLLDQAALTRTTHEELQMVAIPDPRVLAGLGALIFLLRRWRGLRRAGPVPQPA
jgi:hypothetical protein